MRWSKSSWALRNIGVCVVNHGFQTGILPLHSCGEPWNLHTELVLPDHTRVFARLRLNYTNVVGIHVSFVPVAQDHEALAAVSFCRGATPMNRFLNIAPEARRNTSAQVSRLIVKDKYTMGWANFDVTPIGDLYQDHNLQHRSRQPFR